MTNCKLAELRARKEERKQKIRLLRILSACVEGGVSLVKKGNKMMMRHRQREHHFVPELLQSLGREELIAVKCERVFITNLGLQHLKRELGLDVEARSVPANTTSRTGNTSRRDPPRVNKQESPLARLFARKKPDGSRYLTEYEFEAGERLRRDFERGQLQPRITANYGPVSGGSSKGARSKCIPDISDMALDARSRVNDAIMAMGPELSGIALDICCFLKHFEAVEKERQWPPRSAKLMLRTALSRLSRHYGFENNQSDRNNRVYVWGSEGFRPRLHTQ